MSLLARLPCKVQFWTEGFLKKPWTGQRRLFMIQTLALWLRWNGLLGGTSIYWNLIWFNWSEWILVNHAVVSKILSKVSSTQIHTLYLFCKNDPNFWRLRIPPHKKKSKFPLNTVTLIILILYTVKSQAVDCLLVSSTPKNFQTVYEG